MLSHVVQQLYTVYYTICILCIYTGGVCVRSCHSTISKKISSVFFADFFLGFGVCEIEFLQKSNQQKMVRQLQSI
jgi:hypothetical protein